MGLKSLFYKKGALNQAAQDFDGLVEINQELKEKLQAQLLQAYDCIVELCNKNDIKVCLVGGSALGAVRHKGFIPWDDDLDIAMSRSDYRKFLKVSNELPDGYILNAPNFSKNPKARFAKVIKKGTIFKEIIDIKNEELQGIYIDIFIIENIPDNCIVKNIIGFFANAIEFVAGQVQVYENRDELIKKFYMKSGKTTWYTTMIVGFLGSFLKSYKWFGILDSLIDCKEENSKMCGIPTGRKHYFGEILPRNIYFPFVEGEFCARDVYLPGNYDAYLKNLYNNYMEIPPENKRERHFIKEIKI